jgi:hypothetical protein
MASAMGFLLLLACSSVFITVARRAALVQKKGDISPLLGNGKAVDWWFAFKLNTENWPGCSTERKCSFGGEVQDYPTGFGLQYVLASHVDGQTSPLEFHSQCLGSGSDPVAKTFAQVFDGSAANYVIWNDQFYGDPIPDIRPPCNDFTNHACGAPWGHSKGVLAWGDDGSGFVMQVSTPSWPGNGDPNHRRKEQGNTLGCIKDDNAKVAQHFFALNLKSTDDTEAVLQALRRASVATDPSNTQLVKLSDEGPSRLAALARSLGQLDHSQDTYSATLSIESVQLVAKPYALAVPPWQLVSSILGASLRTATWWATPKILSSYTGEVPGCWNSTLAAPKEVQIALTGQWNGKEIGFLGINSPHGNHAKVAHSLGGSLSVFGDMNQEGSYNPSDDQAGCPAHQSGRGGLFFAVNDVTLHKSVQDLLKGDTAPYYRRGHGHAGRPKASTTKRSQHEETEAPPRKRPHTESGHLRERSRSPRRTSRRGMRD